MGRRLQLKWPQEWEVTYLEGQEINKPCNVQEMINSLVVKLKLQRIRKLKIKIARGQGAREKLKKNEKRDKAKCCQEIWNSNLKSQREMKLKTKIANNTKRNNRIEKFLRITKENS